MSKGNRYNTSGLIEDMYEPGSRRRVLKNKLGITRKRVMDEIEAREQLRALHEFLGMYDREHRFSAMDICHMHKVWLGDVYEWAGQYRQVNISKNNFTFAMALQVPKLMKEFEQDQLNKLTPCLSSVQEEVIHAIAVVHTELILIHPFREGNGRLARILSVIMGLQAGFPPFDFGFIKGKARQHYFAAVHAGMSHNYQPMEGIFRAVLARSLRQGQGGC
ncbi:MAG: Fic family protein [Desulfatirhabdiaceae bacterium]